MVSISKNAVVKSALRMFWTDSMTVYVSENVENSVSKITKTQKKILITNEICKLSYKAVVSTSGDNFGIQGQTVKLFCDENLVIPAGSTIEVTRNGSAMMFKQSGKPAVFSNHQEIMLELGDPYA